MNKFQKILLGVGIIVLGVALYALHLSYQTAVFGAFNPSGGSTYRVQSSVSSSGTTITLASFKEPVSNIPYTMSYLNSSIEYGTLEPQSSNKEFVSFTGITQNADGTATLTGVVRGLGFSYPYTASTTLQQPHPGQSIFILSNPPQLTNQYGNKNNNDVVSGLWTFTDPPIATNSATNTLQFATIGYANAIAVQGAATSGLAVSGIGLLASKTQAANGTYPINSPYFLSTLLSTSTYVSTGANQVVVTGATNKFDPQFIATSTVDMMWSFLQTFTGGLTSSATTTIAASSVTNNALSLNGIAYKFPSVQGASSTALSTNGSGTLTWYKPDWSLIASTTLNAAVASTTLSIPAATNLRIIIDIPATSGSDISGQFNTDTAGNYTYNLTDYAGTQVAGGSVSVFKLTSLSMISASTAKYFTLDIQNITARGKTGTIRGASAASGSSANNFGAFFWNNTNAQITSFTLGALGNLPVGTRIDVYGSNF